MAIEFYIVEGLGDGNPIKYTVSDSETIRDLKGQFAQKFGIPLREIELSTDTTKLTNEHAKVVDVIEDGDTINVIPRAKAGQ